MTQVTVDNSVVSVVLGDGDSTTVPTGEKWDVTLVIGCFKPDLANSAVAVTLNGGGIMSSDYGGNSSGQSVQTTLHGGDTIGFQAQIARVYVHIGGYVVS